MRLSWQRDQAHTNLQGVIIAYCIDDQCKHFRLFFIPFAGLNYFKALKEITLQIDLHVRQGRTSSETTEAWGDRRR